jgi:hypothetical protein
MDRYDDPELNRDLDTTTPGGETHGGETHATTGGAAAAGAVTGGVIGLTGGPLGAAIGAVGGAIVGAAAERIMHSEDDSLRAASVVDEDTTFEPSDRAETSSTDISSSTATHREAVLDERQRDDDLETR